MQCRGSACLHLYVYTSISMSKAGNILTALYAVQRINKFDNEPRHEQPIYLISMDVDFYKVYFIKLNLVLLVCPE